MKRRLKAIPVLTALALALLISPIQVLAAQPAAKEYTVTYRPGNIARFTEELFQEYKDYYGEGKVSMSQATGSISITVPAGSIYPEAPQAGDIVLDEEHKGRYYVTTDWRPTEETVMQDQDYVVDYAALIDAVEYSIRYVDAQTGMDVITPTITQGNAGDTITYTAKVIEHYEWDAYLKQMVLEKGKENVLTFYYTYVKHPEYETIIQKGETIYNVITLPGREVPGESGQGSQGTGVGGQGNQGAGEAGQGNQGTGEGGQGSQGTGEAGQGTQGSDEDSQGSQGAGEESGESGEGTGNQGGNGEIIIDEEPVPLAQFLKDNGAKVGLLIGGIAALGALLAVTLHQMSKNKKNGEE